jgi:hypothetical protein
MKKQETQRILVTLPEHVYNHLKRLSAVEEVPMAAIMRHALVEWMKEQGIKVRDDVVWGGARYTPQENPEDEGESEPVAYSLV